MRKLATILDELIIIQNREGWLSEESLRSVALKYGLSYPEARGCATFYTYFRFTPPARHAIHVCIGTACHMKGAEKIYETFREKLSIADNEDIDPKGLFSVDKVACLGCCMLAPAVQIDDTIYGPVNPEDVEGTIKTFLASQFKKERQLPVLQTVTTNNTTVQICSCTSCRSAGSESVRHAVIEHVAARKLPVNVEQTGCTGISHQSPLLQISHDNGKKALWGKVTPRLARRIIDEYLTGSTGAISMTDRLIDLLFTGGRERAQLNDNRIDSEYADIFNMQSRFTFAGCDERDPLSYTSYINAGGGEAIDRCFRSHSREEILQIITESGLRGRGGGGYPTSSKWQMAMQSMDSIKYVICNGDEGDPGAFMDRMLLESVPFAVLEGIAVAVWLLHAAEAILYIRAEYPLAIRQIRHAIDTLKEKKVIGPDAAIPELRVPFTVVEGAGAFVCGEETALLESLEGRRGIPRPRPPFPSESGYYNHPTIINNVETFASIPSLISNTENFTRHGKGNNRGTKSFALAGKINRPGLIEVPLGTTLRTIIEDIGGGVPDGSRFKAVQIGGPSGGCLDKSALDVPIDFDSLAGIGAMMGSGGIIVLDTNDCMVEMARYFTAFSAMESCGRCVICRTGNHAMTDILTRITTGSGKPEDLDSLKRIGNSLKSISRCGLGRTSANPVLSTLTHFEDEYLQHIDGRCPAGVCRELTLFEISDDCIGCTRCARECPTGAIAFTPGERHIIQQKLCIRCGTCRRICPEGAVYVSMHDND
ncbi:MAG: NAD(P)H-dependent oxidoreductase subunit E [Spirochaetes bacterium]|nr:NAD(P)H-dependent oxidoreductase subunit E [Spirochaetota bacterium]